MNSKFKSGVLWVASNAEYVEEAILSVRQLSRNNPNLPTALVTSESDPELFDYYIYADLGKKNCGDKIAGMKLSPFNNTLFLDTDCYVLSDISKVFELMKKYDICCRIGNVRSKGLAQKMPQIYPELHTGVVLYNNSLKQSDIFDEWNRSYDEFNLENDQASFSYTIHNSNVDLGIMPPEYNYTNLPQIVYGEIKILHVRLTDLGLKPNLRNIDKLERKINKFSHLRVSRGVPIRKIKFDYVEVRSEFNLIYQFLYSIWFNGPLYTLEHSKRHLSNRLLGKFYKN